jgi:hypothetical protein
MNNETSTRLGEGAHAWTAEPAGSRSLAMDSDRRAPGGTQIHERKPPLYIPVTIKFVLAQIGAVLWVLFSFWIALPWIDNLDNVIGPVLTILIILGVAILPGYISGFVFFSTLLDRRPVLAENRLELLLKSALRRRRQNEGS